jgi:hypothetical protein
MYCKAVGYFSGAFRFKGKMLPFANPKENTLLQLDSSTFLTPATAHGQALPASMITSSKETVTIL